MVSGSLPLPKVLRQFAAKEACGELSFANFLAATIWAAREHVIRHGDCSVVDGLFTYLLRNRFPDAGDLIRIIEKYCPVAYARSEGGRFRLFRRSAALTSLVSERQLLHELSELHIPSGGRKAKSPNPVQGSTAKFRAEPVTGKGRVWRDGELERLSIEELRALQRNAHEAKHSYLAHRCDLELNAKSFAEEAPEANALLRGRQTPEEMAAAISIWPRERLKKVIEKLENKAMPGTFSGRRKILLAELNRAKRRTRRGGGNPFLPGGRADGNKPDRRRRPGTG